MKAPRIVPLARNWRLWAALPPNVAALTIKDTVVRRRVVTHLVASVSRPAFPKGVCRQCGCTEHDPCVDALGECCAWTDQQQRLCDFCRGGVRRRRSRKTRT